MQLDQVVGRARFAFKDGKVHRAGTAFLVNHNSQTLLLTALHVFGPAGGMRKQIPGEKVKDVVQGAFFFDIEDRKKQFETLFRPFDGKFEPMVDDEESCDPTGDMQAFILEQNSNTNQKIEQTTDNQTQTQQEKSIPAFSLAKKSPAVGSTCYLIGSEVGSWRKKRTQGQTIERYKGKVIQTESDLPESSALQILLEENPNTICFSGAPCVNEQNEVVGIMSSSDDENQTGEICTFLRVEKIHAHLNSKV